jgi:beta-glucosidase
LSYTTFSYNNPELSKTEIEKEESTQVQVEVRNTGNRAGEEVVQLYIRDEFSSVARPVKELKAYQRIALAAGESKTISFEIKPEMLSFYKVDMSYGVEAGTFQLMIGSSSRQQDLKKINLTVRE